VTTSSRTLSAASAIAISVLLVAPALGQQAGQNIPAKTLPVPTVDVSPEIQKVIALPLRKDWDLLPKIPVRSGSQSSRRSRPAP
jgi:epsilon-lactone hydrolase